MRVRHLFSGDDGASHFGELELPEDPVAVLPVESVRLVEFPAGRWHDYVTSAAPHLLVNLSGSAVLEVGSGEQWTITPGALLLAEDTTGQGHRSQTGDEPRKVLMLRLAAGFDTARWSVHG